MFRQRKSTELVQSSMRETKLPFSKDTETSVDGVAAIREETSSTDHTGLLGCLQACCTLSSYFLGWVGVFFDEP